MSTGHAVCDGKSGAADMFRANGIFPAENETLYSIKNRYANDNANKRKRSTHTILGSPTTHFPKSRSRTRPPLPSTVGH
ncbi:hypothetical protein T4D_10623 [Trichinella pseudospiralis]|uniref:Uncharacterized protein n=1 Tax=Trichinella pseudospiralis TaxID=6337 RepID=A0A0V1F3X2_TRIPS|nr:hypothetical protein T4D_10623 [Trichinella pseudospiralis]